jgi:hypothetical protein
MVWRAREIHEGERGRRMAKASESEVEGCVLDGEENVPVARYLHPHEQSPLRKMA